MSDVNRTPVPQTRASDSQSQESRINMLEAESVQVRREIDDERGLNARSFVQVSEAMEKMFGRVSQEMERIETTTTQRFENLGNKIEAKIDVVVRGIDFKIDTNKKELDTKLDTMAKEVAPKRISPLSLVIGLFSLVMAVGGIIWAASRYPERSEFNEEKKARVEMRDELRDTMRDVRYLKELERRTP